MINGKKLGIGIPKKRLNMRWNKIILKKIKGKLILPWLLCACLLISRNSCSCKQWNSSLRGNISNSECPECHFPNCGYCLCYQGSRQVSIISEHKDNENRLWYKIKIDNSIQGFIASWVVDSVIKQETETPVSGKKQCGSGVKIRLQPSLDAEIDQIVNTTVEKIILAEIKDNENRTWFRIQLNSGKWAG